MQSKKQPRIETVDSLRGIASLAVCWFHLTNTYPASSPVRISGQYGWLGVEVFFVISGFIIPYILYQTNFRLRSHWRTFIARRIIRLDPPYLAAVALTILLWHLSTFMPDFQGSPPRYSLKSLLLHLGYLNDIFHEPWLSPVFWTLAIEFQFYFFITLLFPLLTQSTVLKRFLVLGLLSSIAFLFPSRIVVSGFLCLFLSGIVTFQFFIQLISAREYFTCLAVLSVLTTLSFNGQIACVALLSSIIIGVLPLRTIPALSFLGTISYSLYLIHVPVGGRVVNLLRRVASSEVQFLCTSLIALAVSILAAWIFYRIIEQPAQRWARQQAYPAQIKDRH